MLFLLCDNLLPPKLTQNRSFEICEDDDDDENEEEDDKTRTITITITKMMTKMMTITGKQ